MPKAPLYLDQEDWDKLHSKLDACLGYINSLDEHRTTPIQQEWITLKEWCILYSKGKSSWYDKYVHFIKHNCDPSLLIYKPSMDKYLLEHSIN